MPPNLESLCQGDLHPKAIEGIELFNAGRYWDAHEALEEAWLGEASELRNLYKGILQAGVMYYQIQNENFIGMAKMYLRSKKWLADWPDECLGLAIGKLREDVDVALRAAGKLGPDKLGEFDQAFFKKLERIE